MDSKRHYCTVATVVSPVFPATALVAGAVGAVSPRSGKLCTVPKSVLKIFRLKIFRIWLSTSTAL